MKVPKRLSDRARKLSDLGQSVWSRWTHPPATLADAVKILGRDRILGLTTAKGVLLKKIDYTIKALKLAVALNKAGTHDHYLLFLNDQSVKDLIKKYPKYFTAGTQRYLASQGGWLETKTTGCRLINARPIHLGTTKAFEQLPDKNEYSVARMSTALQLYIALKQKKRAPDRWSHVDIQCYYPRDRLPPEAIIAGVADGELLMWRIDLSQGLRTGVERIGVITCYKPDAVT